MGHSSFQDEDDDEEEYGEEAGGSNRLLGFMFGNVDNSGDPDADYLDEVGLSNILERIVETLRDNTKVSYLFLKLVSKKEAPDYLNIVSIQWVCPQ
ncbi:transcription initiation factor TFIID subunit 1-like [Hibiscus syriacus]|uniref:transcription initiation factor TFIID subunit 1-like n=1 Tax=Hibiscus syriacus TaxID=106335 RepID=UPI001920B7DF|nr:transcription initiation factor TFIID subunit 1-like [Hibiscus syriacus]